LYLTGDTPTLTQRSANGWPPRNHSLSISPSNLEYRVSRSLHQVWLADNKDGGHIKNAVTVLGTILMRLDKVFE